MLSELIAFLSTSTNFEQIGKYGTDSENILFRGDNISVFADIGLFLYGKVKCIYIAPPYNTKCEFFGFSDSMNREEWLLTIEPRLKELWKFLREDGSIWISIDDNEFPYLKVLCDTLWGGDCYLSTIVRQKNDAPRDTVRHITHMHDYILVYAKNKEKCKLNKLQVSHFDEYFKVSSDSKGQWVPESLLGKGGSEYDYEIATPNGYIIKPPKGRFWLISKTEFDKLEKDNLICYGENNNEIPARKRYIAENNLFNPTTLWRRCDVGDNQEARLEVSRFNPSELFYVPKPEKMVATILSIASSPGDIVIDAYLGSGTTAAVAHKMGRTWIGIEQEKICDTHCLPRLLSVLSGEDRNGISNDFEWRGDGGFHYYKLVKCIEGE